MIIPYRPSHPFNNFICKNIVLVGGCFDVLHYGHVTFLKKAKSFGHSLVVALEHDDTIRLSKKRHPFHAQQQRAEILDDLKAVDQVLLLPRMETDEEYLSLVQYVNPHFIIYTQGDPYALHKNQQAQYIGAQSIEVPFEKGFSTTALLERYGQS